MIVLFLQTVESRPRKLDLILGTSFELANDVENILGGIEDEFNREGAWLLLRVNTG